jgi:hypothetical protein
MVLIDVALNLSHMAEKRHVTAHAEGCGKR